MAAATEWPIPKFHFRAEWDGHEIAFQEISGLTLETEGIEYRAGNDQTFLKQRIPGLKKHGTLTMKKGVFKGHDDFYTWFNDVQANPERRKAITISLLDEEGQPVVTWNVNNAFPVKFSAPDLKADANEIAVESMEFAFEGFDQTMS